eukprot:scaffold32912_cov60-Phaeocystis_antarctica.AAC.4
MDAGCRRRKPSQAEVRHGGDASRHASHCARGVRAELRLVRGRAPGSFARERPRIHRGGGATADAREAMQTVVKSLLTLGGSARCG